MFEGDEMRQLLTNGVIGAGLRHCSGMRMKEASAASRAHALTAAILAVSMMATVALTACAAPKPTILSLTVRFLCPATSPWAITERR